MLGWQCAGTRMQALRLLASRCAPAAVCTCGSLQCCLPPLSPSALQLLLDPGPRGRCDQRVWPPHRHCRGGERAGGPPPVRRGGRGACGPVSRCLLLLYYTAAGACMLAGQLALGIAVLHAPPHASRHTLAADCPAPLLLSCSPIKGQAIYAFVTLMNGIEYPPDESVRKELVAQVRTAQGSTQAMPLPPSMLCLCCHQASPQPAQPPCKLSSLLPHPTPPCHRCARPLAPLPRPMSSTGRPACPRPAPARSCAAVSASFHHQLPTSRCRLGLGGAAGMLPAAPRLPTCTFTLRAPCADPALPSLPSLPGSAAQDCQQGGGPAGRHLHPGRPRRG